MMRHTLSLLGLATLGLVPPAHSQSVTIYGLLDLAGERLSNVASAGGAAQYRQPGLTGTFPSRLGFRGSEDLGDGLRAIFTLEQGIGLDSGTLNQGGRTFGRQAFVGLAGSWGSLTLGRQYTMLYYSLFDSDILGPNIYSSASLDSYLPNDRVDNSVAYRGTFGGLAVGATYSVGRDAVNAGPSPAGTNCAGENGSDSKACREWSLMAKYDTKNWGAAFAIDEFRGGPGAFGGLNNSGLTDSRATFNGWVKFSELRIGAGVIRRKNEASVATPRSDLWFVGASYPITPLFVADAEVFELKYKDSQNKARLLALRGTYSLSKRTAVYATAGHIANDGTLAISVSAAAAGGTPPAGQSQLGLAAGIRHSF